MAEPLDELIEVLPLAVGVASPEGEITSFNPEFTRIFGYTLEDIPTLDEWWQRAYPDPAYREEVVRGWLESVEAAQLTGGPVIGDEYRVTCKSGEERRVRIFGATVRGVVYAIFNDLTETRDAEHRYREQLDFSQAVIHSAADGICVCHDVNEFPFVRFTVWSQRMEEVTGYTLDEINGLGWYQSLYPDEEVRARANARMDRMRDGENLNAEPWTIARKGGHPLEIAISTSVVPSRDGRVHVLGIMHDRSDEVAAAEERHALERKLSEAQRLESLGVLAGGVAHDFNNLLVAILGHAELAAPMTTEGSELRDKLDSIATAALRASELTNQLLAYSGKGRFVVAATDLNLLIEEMGKLLASSVPKSIELSLELSAELPQVVADAAQIRQVVMNLITNAAEAIDAPSGTVKLRTRSASLGPGESREGAGGLVIEEGDYAVLCVQDDGVGMDEVAIERIFEPFYTSKFTGRGLGLAAVLGIVRGHEGALFVRSIPGEGSTFELWIPAGHLSSSTQTERPNAVKRQTHARRALVVDDEPTVRETTQLLLESLDIEVLAASDGFEALEIFEAVTAGEPFDLVVLDLTMPRKSGEETLKELRALRPDLPIVIVSGYSPEEMNTRFGGQKQTVFLQKPFRLAALADAIATVLPSK